MAFLDESTWRGEVCSGGWKRAAGGEAAVVEPATGSRLGSAGTANLHAFTGARWVTLRGEIAPHPC